VKDIIHFASFVIQVYVYSFVDLFMKLKFQKALFETSE